MEQENIKASQPLDWYDEELKNIDISKAEVIRRQFFSHMKDCMVTIRPNGIQFNTTCISRFEGVTHILMMVDWERNWFIIKPCDPEYKDGQRWCTIKDNERKPRLITGKPASERIYKRLGWCLGKMYKICGTPAIQLDSQDELIMVFEFKDAEDYMLTKKSRLSAGVDDKEINAEDLTKLEDYEKQLEIERQERKQAKEKGRGIKKGQKKGHFPEEWNDSMGVSFDQYKARVEFPHLPANSQEAVSMGMSFLEEEKRDE